MAPMQLGAGIRFGAEETADAARSHSIPSEEIAWRKHSKYMPQKSIHSQNAVTNTVRLCATVTKLSFEEADPIASIGFCFVIHHLLTNLALPNSNVATLMSYRQVITGKLSYKILKISQMRTENLD